MSDDDSSFMLLVDGRPVGPVELAETWVARSHGLLGRDGLDGALLIRPGRSVHTIGMRFPIDVAFCDRSLSVLATVTMPRGRLARPRLRARAVLEASSGSFLRWGLKAGSRLTIGA